MSDEALPAEVQIPHDRFLYVRMSSSAPDDNGKPGEWSDERPAAAIITRDQEDSAWQGVAQHPIYKGWTRYRFVELVPIAERNALTAENARLREELAQLRSPKCGSCGRTLWSYCSVCERNP